MVPDSTDNQKPTGPLRRRWFRIVAVCGGVLAALLVGELIVLLSGVNNDFRTFGLCEITPAEGGPTDLLPHGFVPGATARFTYPTNPRGYFDEHDFGVELRFNSEGWRDSEHTVEKRDGSFRILALGDSYLCGQGVRNEDLCLTHVGATLGESFPQREFETINTGQLGYNTEQERLLLEKRGVSYSPDLVLVAFVPNDVETDIYSDSPKVELFAEFTMTYAGSDWLSDRSELWMLARRKLLFRFAGQQYLRESISSFTSDSEKWKKCRESLMGIRDLCIENRIRLAVAVFPFFVNLDGDYPFQPIHDRVREFCTSESIPVLDLRNVYRDFNGPELWVHPTDQHPNEIAHRIAGDAIAEFLVREKLLE